MNLVSQATNYLLCHLRNHAVSWWGRPVVFASRVCALHVCDHAALVALPPTSGDT